MYYGYDSCLVTYVGSSSSTVIYVGSAVQLDPSLKPRNYLEFVTSYRDYIRTVVATYPGIHPDDVEDRTQEIIKQFIEGDYLNIFCAAKQRQFAERRYNQQLQEYAAGKRLYKPAQIKGKFSSFVWEFSTRRLKGMRDKSNRHVFMMRSLDSSIDSVAGANDDVPSLGSLLPSWQEEFANIETRQLLQHFYVKLCEITTPTETRNLPDLFLALVNGGFADKDGLARDEYANAKGITVSAVSMQIRELRDILTQNGFHWQLKQLIRNRSHPF